MDLHSAAERLGVHYQTAYRWVRGGALKAVKVGTAYEISETDLAEFQARRMQPAPPPTRTVVRSWEHHRNRLFDHLVSGDELGARSVVERLHDGGILPLEICELLLTPVLARVGSAWASGDVSVAEEHRASAICERLLARMSVHPRGRPRGIAVVATCVGEEHSMPAAMAALALRSDRWQVHHLGTQVPTDDLVDLVRALAADLVVLSTTNLAAAANSAAVARKLRETTRAEVLVGQPGDALVRLMQEARALTAASARASRG